MKGNLIIISSPSGGGKGTLIKQILQILPNIGYSVSFTTREMRVGETNGKDYFFVSRAEFETLIENGALLEFAEVHHNFYGTSIEQVKTEIEVGHDVILEIDVQGAESVLAKVPEAVSIFILPPSFEVLAARLTARATETADVLALRLQNSFGEVSSFTEFEYVVINDEVEKATQDLQTIILAERLRRDRQMRVIQGILDSFDETKKSKNHAIGEQT
ncbi:MAG: guanylate kinase [Pyrinomonadaceae bacterium]|nr:guanylate kinase [Pyrinomonadaceae bacterium]